MKEFIPLENFNPNMEVWIATAVDDEATKKKMSYKEVLDDLADGKFDAATTRVWYSGIGNWITLANMIGREHQPKHYTKNIIWLSFLTAALFILTFACIKTEPNGKESLYVIGYLFFGGAIISFFLLSATINFKKQLNQERSICSTCGSWGALEQFRKDVEIIGYEKIPFEYKAAEYRNKNGDILFTEVRKDFFRKKIKKVTEDYKCKYCFNKYRKSYTE